MHQIINRNTLENETKLITTFRYYIIAKIYCWFNPDCEILNYAKRTKHINTTLQ